MLHLLDNMVIMDSERNIEFVIKQKSFVFKSSLYRV